MKKYKTLCKYKITEPSYPKQNINIKKFIKIHDPHAGHNHLHKLLGRDFK